MQEESQEVLVSTRTYPNLNRARRLARARATRFVEFPISTDGDWVTQTLFPVSSTRIEAGPHAAVRFPLKRVRSGGRFLLLASNCRSVHFTIGARHILFSPGHCSDV